MYLSSWHPSARGIRFPLEQLLDALNVDEKAAPAAEKAGPTVRVPRVEVKLGEDAHTLIAELPGVAPEAVKITAERGTLKLEGPTAQWVWRRNFTLPDDVDVDNIGAKLEHGLLTVRLPRAAASRPRQIRVDSAQ